MLSIGELARHTGVSVRMLRHYDAVGLVRPEQVDQVTGYRWYAPSQIGRVASLVTLKELGFTLDQCRFLLDERVSFEEMRGMLRLRRAELEQRLEADLHRLAGVERRLRSIEEGMSMTESTLRLQPLPALRLAHVSGEVNDTSEIRAMVGALTEALAERLAAVGASTVSRVHIYDGRLDGSKIDVTVGVPLAPGEAPAAGLDVAELPAVERAAVVRQHRTNDDTTDPWLTVDTALAQRALESYGPYRQVHLRDAEDGGGVVELQCPVRDSKTCP
jgi:DNA-binding transcriptional MerR regulator